MLKIFSIIFLMSLQTHAEMFKRYSAGFKKKDQVRSVFHLKLESGLNCSGFFIGQNGQALTNLHCIEECLVQNGAVKTEALEFATKNKVNVDANQPITCNAEFSQGKKAQPLAIKVLKVFGPGFLAPRDRMIEFYEKFPTLYNQALSEGFEGWGDLALIQLPMESSCLKVGSADFSKPEPIPVFSLGYPIVFRTLPAKGPMTPEALFTMGLTLLYSQGEATRNTGVFGQTVDQADLDFILGHMPQGTFLSSVDVEGGSSGSPLFNLQNEVIGVVRSTFNPSLTDFRAWMAEGLDLAKHRSEILRLVPENAKCLPSSGDLK